LILLGVPSAMKVITGNILNLFSFFHSTHQAP
jgi:hypothetical protein